MARPRTSHELDSLYERYICQEEMQFGGVAFYRRPSYTNAFSGLRHCLDVGRRPGDPDVHEIVRRPQCGAGSCRPAHGVHGGPQLGNGRTNLCKAEASLSAKCDFVFFIEVIDHLPIPGYIALGRLRKVMQSGGVIICTTSNFHRLRNVMFMELGQSILEYCQYPDEDVDLSHMLEYGHDRVDLQMKNGRLTRCRVEYSQMRHSPTNSLHRPLVWRGYPVHLVPRWRDNLVATSYAPADTKEKLDENEQTLK